MKFSVMAGRADDLLLEKHGSNVALENTFSVGESFSMVDDRQGQS